MLLGFGGGGDRGLKILVGRLLLRSREITREGMVDEGEEEEENDKGTGGDGDGDVIEDIDTEGEGKEEDENEEVEEYGEGVTSSEDRMEVDRPGGWV
jgi:hypothetical protein